MYQSILTNDEVRSMFESLADSSAGEIAGQRIIHTSAICKARVSAWVLDTTLPACQAELAVTLYYTKATRKVQVQAPATIVDYVRDRMLEYEEWYHAALQCPVLPLKVRLGKFPRGGDIAVRDFRIPASHSQMMERRTEPEDDPLSSIEEPGEGKLLTFPDDEEYLAGIISVAQAAHTNLGQYPEWYKKMTSLLEIEFGLPKDWQKYNLHHFRFVMAAESDGNSMPSSEYSEQSVTDAEMDGVNCTHEGE